MVSGSGVPAHTRVESEPGAAERWMLILHGIYGSGRNWGGVARSLVERLPHWGVVLVDLRLHGESTDLPPPHTLEAAAEDVRRLAAELDTRAEAVLGHSFGGKVGLSYARNASGLRQVWMVDSTLSPGPPAGSAWEILDLVRQLPDTFESREALAEALQEHGYARPLGLWLAMNLEREGDRFRWRLDWDAVEEMLRDYFRADVWDVVENPPDALEVHIVKATRSNALDEEALRRIRNSAAQLHEIEAGHWVNADNPGALVELLVGEVG